MGVGEDFKDLRAKEIIGFNLANGRAIVDMGKGHTNEFKMYVSPQGKIMAEKVEVDNSADQEGERRHIPVAERWRSVDQQART